MNPLEDRLAIAAALESTSLVTWFEQDTPLALIVELKPNVLVKGGDWRTEDIVGAGEAAGWGATVRSIPFVHERSTTSLLANIRKR